MPCDQIMDVDECSNNDCEWDPNGNGGDAKCIFPMHEPWMDCIFMDEWECADSPDCDVVDESGYDDGDGDGDDGGLVGRRARTLSP